MTLSHDSQIFVTNPALKKLIQSTYHYQHKHDQTLDSVDAAHMHCYRVLWIDFDAADHPHLLLPRATRDTLSMTSWPSRQGRILSFIGVKGLHQHLNVILHLQCPWTQRKRTCAKELQSYYFLGSSSTFVDRTLSLRVILL